MTLLFRLLVIACIGGGAYIIYSSSDKSAEETVTNKKAAALKSFLVKYKKPQRIEVTSLTERFSADADEIKKLKLPLDPASKIYIAVVLFTDETDSEAPLVAQIKFMDIATENKLSEENINLE